MLDDERYTHMQCSLPPSLRAHSTLLVKNILLIRPYLWTQDSSQASKLSFQTPVRDLDIQP